MTVMITLCRRTENNDYPLFHEKAEQKSPCTSNYTFIKRNIARFSLFWFHLSVKFPGTAGHSIGTMVFSGRPIKAITMRKSNTSG